MPAKVVCNLIEIITYQKKLWVIATLICPLIWPQVMIVIHARYVVYVAKAKKYTFQLVCIAFLNLFMLIAVISPIWLVATEYVNNGVVMYIMQGLLLSTHILILVCITNIIDKKIKFNDVVKFKSDKNGES